MDKGRIKTIKQIINVVVLLGIMLMIGTVVHLSAYTVFVSDDFWHAQHTGLTGGSFLERIKAAWDYNTYMYMNHQGAYSLFFLALFNPVTWGDFRY